MKYAVNFNWGIKGQLLQDDLVCSLLEMFSMKCSAFCLGPEVLTLWSDGTCQKVIFEKIQTPRSHCSKVLALILHFLFPFSSETGGAGVKREIVREELEPIPWNSGFLVFEFSADFFCFLLEILDGVELGEPAHKKTGTTVPESIHSFSKSSLWGIASATSSLRKEQLWTPGGGSVRGSNRTAFEQQRSHEFLIIFWGQR